MNLKYSTPYEYDIEIDRVKKLCEHTTNWKLHKDQRRYLARLERERQYLINGLKRK